MPQLSRPALERIRSSVQLVGRLSDGLIRVGPWGVGLDGVLSWIPGVGEAYGAIAGGFILVQGARAGVPLPTLAGCAALMGGRTAFAAVPLIGPLFADIFMAHRWSARMVVRAIDKKLGGAPEDEAVDTTWRVRPA